MRVSVALFVTLLLVVVCHAANKRKLTENSDSNLRKLVTNKKLKEKTATVRDAVQEMSEEGYMMRAVGPQAILLHNLIPRIDMNMKTWLLSMWRLQKEGKIGKMPLYVKLKIVYDSVNDSIGCMDIVHMVGRIINWEDTLLAMTRSPFYANDTQFIENLAKGLTSIRERNKISNKNAVMVCLFSRAILNAVLLLSGLENRLVVTNRATSMAERIKTSGGEVLSQEPQITYGDITMAGIDRVWQKINYVLQTSMDVEDKLMKSEAYSFYGGDYKKQAMKDICDSLHNERVIGGLHVLLNIVARDEMRVVASQYNIVLGTEKYDECCDVLMNEVNNELEIFEVDKCRKPTKV